MELLYIAIEEIKRRPYNLTHASDRLKNNKEIAKIVLSYGLHFIKELGEKLKNDKNFIPKLKQKYEEYKNISKSMIGNSGELLIINDKSLAIKAVKIDGTSYTRLSNKLKQDKDILILAIKNSGSAIKYARENLQNDKDFEKKVKEKYGKHKLVQIYQKYSNNYDLVKQALKEPYGWSCFEYVSNELKNNREIVDLATKRNPYNIEHANTRFKNDKKLAIKLVKHFGETLDFFSNKIKSDKDV